MKKTRYIIQGLFLILMIFLAVKHQIYKGTYLKTPPLDSYCPFGAIETTYLYLTSGTFLHRVGYSNFIMLFGLIIMGVLLKSGFCGWICPFGTVQEWIGLLGKKLSGGKKYVPEWIDKYGRYLKYILFIVIIAATVVSGRMVFRDYDPFIAFFHMGFGELPWTAYLVLFTVLAGSFFVMRFWCRYFCPLAVIVGFIGKFGIFKIECDAEKCVLCKKCEKLCTMDVKIMKEGRISTVECNSCLDCLEAEDIKGAIALRSNKTGKKLTPAFYPVILLVILFGTIYASKSLGVWMPGRGPGKGIVNTLSDRNVLEQGESLYQGKGAVGRGQGSGLIYPQRAVQRQADTLKTPVETGKKEKTGVPAGEKKKADDEPKGEERIVKIGDKDIVIRGNYTFSQIEDETGVPAGYLLSKLKLPSDTPRNTNIGNLRKQYGFQMQDVRKYIREYLEKNKK